MEFGLERLEEAGFLANGSASRSRENRVFIRSICRTESLVLATALKQAHIDVTASCEQSNLEILLVDSYLDPRIDDLEDEANRAGRAVIPIKPVGATLWIGPITDPPHTPCRHCLATRPRARPAARIERELAARGIRFDGRFDHSLPGYLDLACSLAAVEIRKWRAGNSAVDGVVITLDLRSLDLRHHRVVRLDGCPRCGSPRETDSPEVHLESRIKVFTSDGGHRAAPPEFTFDRLAHHISPVTGVVSKIEHAVASDAQSPVQVWLAHHCYGFDAQDPIETWGTPHYSAGKGMTASQARTGALCEALERYAALFRGTEARRAARIGDPGECAIHPRKCLLYSEAQYAAREDRNRDAAPAA